MFAVAMSLSACHENPAEVRNQDLGAISIPGLVPSGFEGEPDTMLRFAVASLTHAFDERAGSKTSLANLKLVGDDKTRNAAIAGSVEHALGPGWQRFDGYLPEHHGVELMAWETKGSPKRFYGLAAYGVVLKDSQGQAYRPVLVTYSRQPPPWSPFRT